MIRYSLALAALLALAACDNDNPFLAAGADTPVDTPPDEESPVTDAGVPEFLANNLTAISYDPANNTLSVDMYALDRNDLDVPLEGYTRNLALEADAPAGYQVYSYQDDALDRMFVAIVARSPDGSVEGAIVVDGGQFTKFFGGGYYGRVSGDYDPGQASNDTGLVSYAGNYAGLSNFDADGDELLPPAGSPDPSILPSQPAQITGEIFLNVDFDDNSVNGGIYNRSFTNLAPAIEAALGSPNLEDIFIIPTAITNDGTFFGEGNVVDDEQNPIGSAGGVFGGTDSAGLAGTVRLDGDFIDGLENEAEYGVFVLVQCGQAGDAALCDSIPVNP